MVQDFDFHPHEPDVRVFTVPGAGVLRRDDEVFVTHALYDQVVRRRYAFRGHWFKISLTTDLDGNLVETAPADGQPAFAFTIDIATPMFTDAGGIFAVDLDLDVLVRADAQTFAVEDEDAFTASLVLGRFSAYEAAGARQGLADLVRLIEGGDLLPLLQDASPLGRGDVPLALPMLRVPLAEIPQLQPGKRVTWREGSGA